MTVSSRKTPSRWCAADARSPALPGNLGVTPWSLGRWAQLANTGGGQREPATLAAETPEQRELRRLPQENDYLRQQRAILKKSVGHLVSGSASTRHTLIEALQDEHPIRALAEALDGSRSGFFAHRQRDAGLRRQEDRALAREIAPIFVDSRQTDGCPRMTAALRQGGVRCGKHRVARLMREEGLTPKQKRKHWRPATTDSNPRQPVAENWLSKVPAPEQPDQVWVADITDVGTGEGWLYLAGLLDACTRRLVGWQTGETLAAELVT